MYNDSRQYIISVGASVHKTEGFLYHIYVYLICFVLVSLLYLCFSNMFCIGVLYLVTAGSLLDFTVMF